MYIWGQDFTKEIDVDQMINAPIEFKYRPFHESLAKSLLEIYLTGIHPPKQTLTLMPKVDKEPFYFENIKNGEFYIINGQHSVAAAKKLLALEEVDPERKEKFRTWQCDFVWTEDKMLLSELSRRTNNTNQHKWDSPEYLLHVQYCRDLWINYGRPDLKNPGKPRSQEWKICKVRGHGLYIILYTDFLPFVHVKFAFRLHLS